MSLKIESGYYAKFGCIGRLLTSCWQTKVMQLRCVYYIIFIMNLSQSHAPIASQKKKVLLEMAEKYVWWKSVDIALQHPKLIISRVMDIGDYQDVQQVADSFSDDILKEVLLTSEPGAFRPRSWAYWNYRLGTATPGYLPPAPVRQFNR